MSATDPIAPWNDPERVQCFASRDPDHRLVELVEAIPYPQGVTVLDLGCAGGRNAEYLVLHQLDLWALDAAEAMVARTRERVAAVLGPDEAERRVIQGVMDDLARWEDETFHLVVALGVYHQAQSEAEWYVALAETERVLVPGGRCLVSNFAPGTGPIDSPPEKISGTRFLHQGFKFGKGCLLTLEQLDAEFQRHGFDPVIPTRLVEKEADGRQRNTVNGLYRKRA